MSQKQLLRFVLIVFLLTGLAASGNGWLDHLVQSAGMQSVTADNRRYLQDSFDRATAGFLVLSGIKSGLAVIEGSEVGIGFNLEIGDVVQSIYDYVDIAWKTTLTGGVVLWLTRLTLDGVAVIDHMAMFVLFGMALLFCGLCWWLPRAEKTIRFLREMLLLWVVFTITLYCVIPLSISAASYLSKKISQPLIRETQQKFAAVQDQFSAQAMGQKLFPKAAAGDTDWYGRLNLSRNIGELKDGFARLQVYLQERLKWIAVWTMQLIAGYVFDCILFPLFFLFALVMLTRATVRYGLGVVRYTGFKQDLAAIVNPPENRPDRSRPLPDGG